MSLSKTVATCEFETRAKQRVNRNSYPHRCKSDTHPRETVYIYIYIYLDRPVSLFHAWRHSIAHRTTEILFTESVVRPSVVDKAGSSAPKRRGESPSPSSKRIGRKVEKKFSKRNVALRREVFSDRSPIPEDSISKLANVLYRATVARFPLDRRCTLFRSHTLAGIRSPPSDTDPIRAAFPRQLRFYYRYWLGGNEWQFVDGLVAGVRSNG